MRILVEVSQGLGDCIQGTPLCHALHLLGHEVDLFVFSNAGKAAAKLFEDWQAVGQVYTNKKQFDERNYDFGCSCYGRRELVRRFPAGRCLKVEPFDMDRQSASEANCEMARRLGYKGETPPSHVHASKRHFSLKPGTVVIHAGCKQEFAFKRWPHWPKVCRTLKERGHDVIIVGTDTDRSAEGWESEFQTHFNLPLTELAALLGQATAYFGNDSGVGHMAAAMGVPGAILYGPSSPVSFGPNSRVLKAIAARPEAGEEHDIHASRPVPIGRISIDEVMAAVDAALADPRKEEPRQLMTQRRDSRDFRRDFLLTTILEKSPRSAIGEAMHLYVRDAMELKTAAGYTEAIARVNAMHALLWPIDKRDARLFGPLREEAAKAELQLSRAKWSLPQKKFRLAASDHAKQSLRYKFSVGALTTRILTRAFKP
jgi:ADP-heptose:LPS heptosyltransferase